MRKKLGWCWRNILKLVPSDKLVRDLQCLCADALCISTAVSSSFVWLQIFDTHVVINSLSLCPTKGNQYRIGKLEKKQWSLCAVFFNPTSCYVPSLRPSICYQVFLTCFPSSDWGRQVSYPNKTPSKTIFGLMFGIVLDNIIEDMCLQPIRPEPHKNLNFRFITVLMKSRQASAVRRCCWRW